MKLTLNQDPSFAETEIIINCPQADEDALRELDFFRAGRSTILNFRRVRSVRPELGRRWLVTMDNGEQIWVSRQYAGELREKLRQAERSIFQ